MRLPNQSPCLIEDGFSKAWNESTGIVPSQNIQFLPSTRLPTSFWHCYWSCLLFIGGNRMNCFASCLPVVWASFRP